MTATHANCFCSPNAQMRAQVLDSGVLHLICSACDDLVVITDLKLNVPIGGMDATSKNDKVPDSRQIATSPP